MKFIRMNVKEFFNKEFDTTIINIDHICRIRVDKLEIIFDSGGCCSTDTESMNKLLSILKIVE